VSRKRGAEPFEFTMSILGVFTVHCRATFHGGQLVSVFGYDASGVLIEPDGVILDWEPAGDFIPFAECMRWHAQSIYNKQKRVI